MTRWRRRSTLRQRFLHADHRAAAHWLAIIQLAPANAIGWRQEIVSAYAEWTGRMNGLGHAADAEISREPNRS